MSFSFFMYSAGKWVKSREYVALGGGNNRIEGTGSDLSCRETAEGSSLQALGYRSPSLRVGMHLPPISRTRSPRMSKTSPKLPIG